MKRTGEKTMMKTILLSAILLSTNCVTQVEYFDTGANKGDVNIYNPQDQTGSIDYPIDQDNGSGDAIFSFTGQVETAMVDYYMSNPVNITQTNQYVESDEEIQAYMAALSYEDLVVFEALFRIASDLHNFPGGSKYTLAQYWAEDISFTQDVIYNTLFEMDDSFLNFFSDISSRYSANDLIFYTHSVVQAQRNELNKRMEVLANAK
jgi:hypothetical protein